MNEGCERERGEFPEAEGAQCFAAFTAKLVIPPSTKTNDGKGMHLQSLDSSLG